MCLIIKFSARTIFNLGEEDFREENDLSEELPEKVEHLMDLLEEFKED